MSRHLRFFLLFLLPLLFVCCDTEDLVFPDIPPEEESAKDNLPWPLTQYNDEENYRPGDDFYLFCNGKYWKNAPMGTKRIVGFFDTEMVEAMKQRKASISNPVYERLQESGSVQVTNAQFYAFLKPFYEKIDGIGSIEDAFRVAGELKMAGARMLCNLSPIQDGDVLLSLDTRGPFDVYGGHRAFLESDQPDDVYSYLSTHPTTPEDWNASAAQAEYWDEHMEEDMVFSERAEELVKQYLLPALGLKAEDYGYGEGFKNWLVISLEELKAYMKMTVFQDYAAYANQQGFDFISDWVWPYNSPYDLACSMTSRLKRYLDERLLLERYVSADLKREVEGLCRELKSIFCKRIESLAWMSATTKLNAIRKVNAIQFFVGYPNRWLVDYPDLSGCTNMLEDMQVILKEKTRMEIGLVGDFSKEDIMNAGVFYGITLLQDTAYYQNSCNAVVIHAPFILPPMYAEDMHPAMKYGMLMDVIGHELTHAVDSNGSQYDENGKEADWWTIQDRIEYEALQKRLVELYNRLAPLPDYPSLHTDGEQTLAENLSDLGGLEMAHDAFVAYCKKEGFKGEDLDEMERKFFRSYAEYFRSRYGYEFYLKFCSDVHAFDRERVNGVLMNMDRWYELFDVKWGDYLYLKPENRTRIW